ncbi:MAG: hypothetical protein AVDCRST_MAG19-3721 [uncultured Thermomicrobiales bacterium]|uniref:Uncharacterized protein n=1 Tax=uncultured Thermomicrobiales bacterium TaxID=1645740 RepID=A0A6J4VHH6_9BACT|nr:MAG: hypothetical protein AVDCRST_MAG19-3721 [uncultured Thermomicrobiales bacterium]
MLTVQGAWALRTPTSAATTSSAPANMDDPSTSYEL